MYTYAFLPRPTDPFELPEGITETAQLLTVGQIAALVEPHLVADALQLSDEQLMRAVIIHDRVICDVFEQVPVLPLRFGTFFVSQQNLLEHLTTHHDAYLLRLEALRGKAEFSLKLMPVAAPEHPMPSDLKGKAYFLAKKQQYQAQTDWQQQQQQQLDQILGAIAQTYDQWQRVEPDQGIERLYLLSDRHSEAVLQQHCNQWQQQYPHWEFVLGDALPPYHFV